MFFDAGQTGAAFGAVVPDKAPKSQEPSQHLNQQQFGKKAGPAEAEGGAAAEGAGAGAAEGAAAAGGAEAGAAGLAELAPLLLL